MNLLQFQMTSRVLKLPTSYTLCVSPTERLVAALGRNVALADIKDRRRLVSWHLLSHPSHAAFSPDESLLAIKSTWGEIVIVEASAGTEVSRHRPKQQDEGSALHFSPCGRFIVDGSWSGQLRVRRVEDLSVEETFVYDGEMITNVSASADASVWLVAHKPKHSGALHHDRLPYMTLWEWPLKVPKCRFVSGAEGVEHAALSPAGDCIAVRGYSSKSDTRELRLISLDGDLIASAAVTGGHWKQNAMVA